MVAEAVEVSPTFGSEVDSGLTRFSSTNPVLPTFVSRRPSLLVFVVVGAPVSADAPVVGGAVVKGPVADEALGSDVLVSKPVVPLTALAFSSRLSIADSVLVESVTPAPVLDSISLSARSLFENVKASLSEVSEGSLAAFSFAVDVLSEVVRRLVGVSLDVDEDSGRRTAPAEGLEVGSVVVGLGFDVRVDLAGRRFSIEMS